MRNLLIVLVIAWSGPAMASQKAETKKMEAQTEAFKLIHTADLDKMMQMNSQEVFIFDANNDKTRNKNGIIPGAKPLDSVSEYSTSILPSDKTANVVFYCANTECMASHQAAKHAVKAGYTNVAVMADGIEGWKKAGKPTQKYAVK